MKILCLIDSLDSGGAQRQLVGLASMLNQYHKVEVLSYWDIHFWDEYLNKHQVSYHTINDAHNQITKFYKVQKHIRKYDPDVVIAYLNAPTVIACLIRLLFYMKFFLIVSDRNTTQCLNLKERFRFFVYKWADVIVPNSISQANFINCYYPKLSDKIVTITNFVNTDYFIPCYRNKNNSMLTMLVVGRIAPQKNVLKFIEAIKIVHREGYGIIVNWFGRPNPVEYYQQCVEKLNQYELADIFQFLEPTTEILLEYQKADVLCLPSIYEGFPNVICEAMSCGLPVLCSNVCDNPNIVDDGINGFLFNPHSEEDIAHKIINYIKLPDEKKRDMGIYSRTIAEKRFSKEAFKNEYFKLINHRK